MRAILRAGMAVCFVVLMIGTSHAVVINFDDSPTGELTGTNYAGLTWGTSTDDSFQGNTGAWSVRDDLSYATPHSSPNYVVNIWGPNNLWFTFPSAVSFSGAWFATANAAAEWRATQVRLRDSDEVSAWLTVTGTPQFLSANFTNSTTVFVERLGGTATPTNTAARWFTMDDITYNASQVPEPTTMLLLGLGLIGLAGGRRTFKK